MSQFCFSLGFLSQNSLWKLSTFRGFKGIYSRIWEECEKSFFCKTRCSGKSLATGMSREFQSPENRMVRLYFFSCSDPAILTLQLPTCSTRVADSGKWPIASQSQVPVASCLFNAYSWSILHTLSHTQPLHNSHLNTRFLNAELQANLARNKANTWLNKFNLTDM